MPFTFPLNWILIEEIPDVDEPAVNTQHLVNVRSGYRPAATRYVNESTTLVHIPPVSVRPEQRSKMGILLANLQRKLAAIQEQNSFIAKVTTAYKLDAELTEA